MATQLSVKRRESRPRSILTALRREGRIPAVVYGSAKENELIHLEGSDLIRFLQQQGLTSVLELKYPDGKIDQVMVRELQHDRIKDKILHVDFKQVKMNEPVEVEVAVNLVGEPKGVKEGGILQQQLRTVLIRTLPGAIPDHIDLDISGMSIGDNVQVRDLKHDEKMELLSDPDEVVASVLPPQVEQEKEAEERDERAAEAEQAEPELVDAEKEENES
ncbi:50S ribosomal protein L25/general stress protein Ctc [Desmospora profundinema]|uniref:Large ribosomal subunit protein bL25 n=1 Tax=Desmospora profundinema TaxID=1571184 RepID=A0ABU1IQW0_9BACL|nr:50S ribosomal protein L25/general stress protein Ctc [Desmospora profundinema]MDR6227108.1 large subunit ribosomal protein L25 [Desmospora profundinema]